MDMDRDMAHLAAGEREASKCPPIGVGYRGNLHTEQALQTIRKDTWYMILLIYFHVVSYTSVSIHHRFAYLHVRLVDERGAVGQGLCWDGLPKT